MRYNPGVWFNSAKFFDIEYQTYGKVDNDLNIEEGHFYWEDREKEKCLRFVFDKERKNLLGLNALGIRLRHNLAEKWIKEKLPVWEAIKNLNDLIFDPEFAKKYHKMVRSEFESSFSGKEVAGV